MSIHPNQLLGLLRETSLNPNWTMVLPYFSWPFFSLRFILLLRFPLLCFHRFNCSSNSISADPAQQFHAKLSSTFSRFFFVVANFHWLTNPHLRGSGRLIRLPTISFREEKKGKMVFTICKNENNESSTAAIEQIQFNLAGREPKSVIWLALNYAIAVDSNRFSYPNLDFRAPTGAFRILKRSRTLWKKKLNMKMTNWMFGVFE